MYYKNLNRSKFAKIIDNHFEKDVLQNAKQIVFVTKSTEEDYIKKYDFLKNKTNVLYWGYDEDDFREIKIEKHRKDEIIIVHAGNLFAYQNPRNFWNQIKLENEKGNNYNIIFIGTVDPIVVDYLEKIGLKEKVNILGFLPYPEMIKQILNADVILVCSSEPRHIPGKLFEALRTGNPIIAFGDNNNEVREIIESTNAGIMFGYENSGKEFFINYKKTLSNLASIKDYDRAEISKKFFQIIKSQNY